MRRALKRSFGVVQRLSVGEDKRFDPRRLQPFGSLLRPAGARHGEAPRSKPPRKNLRAVAATEAEEFSGTRHRFIAFL